MKHVTALTQVSFFLSLWTSAVTFFYLIGHVSLENSCLSLGLKFQKRLMIDKYPNVEQLLIGLEIAVLQI